MVVKFGFVGLIGLFKQVDLSRNGQKKKRLFTKQCLGQKREPNNLSGQVTLMNSARWESLRENEEWPKLERFKVELFMDQTYTLQVFHFAEFLHFCFRSLSLCRSW